MPMVCHFLYLWLSPIATKNEVEEDDFAETL